MESKMAMIGGITDYSILWGLDAEYISDYNGI
jgi:hypothetical protein